MDLLFPWKAGILPFLLESPSPFFLPQSERPFLFVGYGKRKSSLPSKLSVEPRSVNDLSFFSRIEVLADPLPLSFVFSLGNRACAFFSLAQFVGPHLILVLTQFPFSYSSIVCFYSFFLPSVHVSFPPRGRKLSIPSCDALKRRCRPPPLTRCPSYRTSKASPSSGRLPSFSGRKNSRLAGGLPPLGCFSLY